jgi:NADPH:quinone reductase
MLAARYDTAGSQAGLIRTVEMERPEPAQGEVLVRVRVSGVNPTDYKSRRTGGLTTGGFGWIVPNQDGAGELEAVGPGVDPGRVGERVWLYECQWQRAMGSAAQWVAIGEHQAVPLPEHTSLDQGAGLGIPAMTAHRALFADGPIDGATVLVQGGAGAVGHAAIQLARWGGARVIATVSGDEKAKLGRAAGADHVVNYRSADAVEQIRRDATDGVDVIVELAPSANAALDAEVLAANGTVAVYATDGGNELELSVRDLMYRNVRYQFVLVYTVPREVKDQAVADVAAAVADGALPVGADAGLPLHRFPLDQTGAAHDAVERGAIGKVLVDVS